MKNKLLLISILFITLCITGCKTTSFKSYTFKVETGDTVSLKLDTTGGYDMDNKLPFSIYKDKQVLCSGTFLTLQGYETYKKITEDNDLVNVYEKMSKDGLTYIFYNFENEYNYIIKLENSNTALALGSKESKENAEVCFNRLTIKKK